MLSKNALWMIFVVVAAGIATIIYVYSSQSIPSPEQASTVPASESGQSLFAPPTGNADDLTREMTEELSSESILITETDDESALIDEEIKALDELGQSYDENEF